MRTLKKGLLEKAYAAMLAADGSGHQGLGSVSERPQSGADAAFEQRVMASGQREREAGAGSRRRAVWFPTDLCALLLAAKFNQTKVR